MCVIHPFGCETTTQGQNSCVKNIMGYVSGNCSCSSKRHLHIFFLNSFCFMWHVCFQHIARCCYLLLIGPLLLAVSTLLTMRSSYTGTLIARFRVSVKLCNSSVVVTKISMWASSCHSIHSLCWGTIPLCRKLSWAS